MTLNMLTISDRNINDELCVHAHSKWANKYSIIYFESCLNNTVHQTESITITECVLSISKSLRATSGFLFFFSSSAGEEGDGHLA